MIRDDLWLRALRRSGRRTNPGSGLLYNPSTGSFGRRGCGRCGFAFDGRTGQAFDASKTCPSCGGKPGAANPQLQVIGHVSNPGSATLDLLPRVDRAVRKFHGVSTGKLLDEYEVDDGKEEITESLLGYLGDCPAISWMADDEEAKDHDILVEKEHVTFRGIRKLFRGSSMPTLSIWIDPAVAPDDQLAVITGGGVERLQEHCDSDGVLGAAAVVEYVVEKLKGSSKGDNWFVHTFQEGLEPVLRWSDDFQGLVYERDRSILRKAANRGSKAVYVVSDWFHEKGHRMHEER